MWAASSTLRVDGTYVGVRSHPAHVDAALRRSLPTYLVDGVEAPANYSIRREPGKGKGTDIYALFRAQCRLLGTRSLGRALRGLLSSLSMHLEPEDERLPRIPCLAVIDGTSALLLPERFLPRLERIEARLNDLDLRLADPPYAALDPATGELILRPPALEVVEDADDSEYPSAPSPGRYTVRAVGILHEDTDILLEGRDGLAALLPLLDGEPAPDAQRAADAVARALQGADVVPVWLGSDEKLLSRLRNELRG